LTYANAYIGSDFTDYTFNCEEKKKYEAEARMKERLEMQGKEEAEARMKERLEMQGTERVAQKPKESVQQKKSVQQKEIGGASSSSSGNRGRSPGNSNRSRSRSRSGSPSGKRRKVVDHESGGKVESGTAATAGFSAGLADTDTASTAGSNDISELARFDKIQEIAGGTLLKPESPAIAVGYFSNQVDIILKNIRDSERLGQMTCSLSLLINDMGLEF
jgi:hypothetical protein